MGATTTTLSNILKRHYLGPVQNQLNNQILVMQILKVESENLEGLQAELPLHTARSGGIGSRGQLEALPAAGNQGYGKAVYDLAYHYGRAQVSGQAIHKTRSEVGSFLRAMKSELDFLKDDLALDFARQVYGDGTAIVAATGTTTASTTVVLADSEAVTRGFLYVGMLIDIGTSANPVAIATAREITDVDVAAATIVISGAAVTTATSDRIFRAGNAAASSVVKEMDAGLQKLIATSANTVGGINAASAGSRYWDNQRDTTGGAIALSSLMINLNKVLNAGVTLDNLEVTSTPGIARRLFETADFKSAVRFVDSTTLNGGFEKLTFSAGAGKISLVTDRLHPRSKLYFIPKKHIRLFSPADWGFLAKDGLNVRWVSDYDAWQTLLFRYANMGTDRRNNSLVMSGLTDTDF